MQFTENLRVKSIVLTKSESVNSNPSTFLYLCLEKTKIKGWGLKVKLNVLKYLPFVTSGYVTQLLNASINENVKNFICLYGKYLSLAHC